MKIVMQPATTASHQMVFPDETETMILDDMSAVHLESDQNMGHVVYQEDYLDNLQTPGTMTG
jgi:hypothetical protein